MTPNPNPTARERVEYHAACGICGEEATCLGSYEGRGELLFACDTCCGHGNEDGWCISVGEAAEAIAAWNRRTPDGELREALDRAEATFKKEERDWRREQPAFRNGARHAFSHVRRSLLTDTGGGDG